MKVTALLAAMLVTLSDLDTWVLEWMVRWPNRLVGLSNKGICLRKPPTGWPQLLCLLVIILRFFFWDSFSVALDFRNGASFFSLFFNFYIVDWDGYKTLRFVFFHDASIYPEYAVFYRREKDGKIMPRPEREKAPPVMEMEGEGSRV